MSNPHEMTPLPPISSSPAPTPHARVADIIATTSNGETKDEVVSADGVPRLRIHTDKPKPAAPDPSQPVTDPSLWQYPWESSIDLATAEKRRQEQHDADKHHPYIPHQGQYRQYMRDIILGVNDGYDTYSYHFIILSLINQFCHVIIAW
jgi:hypothetical protein